MTEKVRKIIDKACDIIELLIAIVVGVGLLYTAVTYILTEFGILDTTKDTKDFLHFLGNMFNLVVGIEFIKMLLKPSAGNVIEVLVFLIARHMIIGENTVIGILVSVVCVILLYGFHHVLHHFHKKHPAEQKISAEHKEEPAETK